MGRLSASVVRSNQGEFAQNVLDCAADHVGVSRSGVRWARFDTDECHTSGPSTPIGVLLDFILSAFGTEKQLQ